MAPTDENEKAGAASLASPRGPAGAEMMPSLPEPWEGLVAKYGYARWEEGLNEEEPIVGIDFNHKSFEAERALRTALGDLLRDKWLLNGRDSGS